MIHLEFRFIDLSVFVVVEEHECLLDLIVLQPCIPGNPAPAPTHNITSASVSGAGLGQLVIMVGVVPCPVGISHRHMILWGSLPFLICWLVSMPHSVHSHPSTQLPQRSASFQLQGIEH